MYANKSIPLDLLLEVLLPLVSSDLVDIHSLQVGVDASSITPYLDSNRIIDWSTQLTSFSDTAYLISQLDLVVTIDSSVAHLSAALNCPTWLLLPYDSDFRWLIDRHDSPWYPKIMRLFQQTQIDDWHSVVQDLKSAFNRLFLVDVSNLCSSEFSE